MPQSLARIDIHIIFSTKNRAPLIADGVRDDLHRYMAGVLQNLDCPADIINSVEDHAHILCELSRTIAIARVLEETKKSTSKWMKTRGDEFADFAWQAGYGAFAVSRSNCDEVRQYIANSVSIIGACRFRRSFGCSCGGTDWCSTSAMSGIELIRVGDSAALSGL